MLEPMETCLNALRTSLKSLADNSMHLQNIYMYMYMYMYTHVHVGMLHLYDLWILGALAIVHVALATCRFGKR